MHPNGFLANAPAHFRRSLRPDLLHFAAHSHHPWPDVTREAMVSYWDETARALDHKWEPIFGTRVPTVQRLLAQRLGFDAPERIAFGPNTLDLVFRAISPIFDANTPARVLTTDSEFHSWDRLVRRLSEPSRGTAWQVTRVPQFPLETFEERWQAALTQESSNKWDIVYISQVFFNSGYAPRNILPKKGPLLPQTLMIVDGYHGAGALDFRLLNGVTPSDSVASQIFYVAGGYKYLQSGEGVCFMTTPPASLLGRWARPLTTGWWTQLNGVADTPSEEVPYGQEGWRYIGATFDPSGIYRMQAVLELMESQDWTPSAIRRHVEGLQLAFLEGLPRTLSENSTLVVENLRDRGNFIALRTASTDIARRTVANLLRNNVVIDHRGPVLRFGFGVYQTPEDVARLIAVLRKAH